jgi:hypothetical protein
MLCLRSHAPCTVLEARRVAKTGAVALIITADKKHGYGSVKDDENFSTRVSRVKQVLSRCVTAPRA